MPDPIEEQTVHVLQALTSSIAAVHELVSKHPDALRNEQGAIKDALLDLQNIAEMVVD